MKPKKARPREQWRENLAAMPPEERLKWAVKEVQEDEQQAVDLLQSWLDEMQERAMNMEAPTDEQLAKRLLSQLGVTQGISFDED